MCNNNGGICTYVLQVGMYVCMYASISIPLPTLYSGSSQTLDPLHFPLCWLRCWCTQRCHRHRHRCHCCAVNLQQAFVDSRNAFTLAPFSVFSHATFTLKLQLTSVASRMCLAVRELATLRISHFYSCCCYIFMHPFYCVFICRLANVLISTSICHLQCCIIPQRAPTTCNTRHMLSMPI